MTRNELIAKAQELVKAASKATPGDRTVMLHEAREYYEEAGQTGLAAWCRRKLDGMTTTEVPAAMHVTGEDAKSRAIREVLEYRDEIASELRRMLPRMAGTLSATDRIREIEYCNRRLKSLGYLPAEAAC